jgi:hypothetical protein
MKQTLDPSQIEETTVDFYRRIEAPIVSAIAEMAAADAAHDQGRLPYAIKVGAAFNAAKEVLKNTKVVRCGGAVTNAGVSHWVEVFCKDLKFSVRSAHDYMLLARYPDVSQSSASIADALEKIAAQREAEGKKRKSPANKKTPKPKPRQGATPDLTEMMRNVGPDEVRVALRDWNPADLRELRRYIDEMLGDAPEPPVEAGPANEDVRLPPVAEPERPSSWFRR